MTQISSLRHLDMDDLILLRDLLQGASISEIAQLLCISQPATSQRIRKIEHALGGVSILKKNGRGVTISEEGRQFADRATAALHILTGLAEEEHPEKTLLYLGTRPEQAYFWITPTLCALKKSHPNVLIHLKTGSSEELLSRIFAGTLDAIVTSAPILPRNFPMIEIVKEEYWFVAAPEAAPQMKSLSDLCKVTFIEYDRTFPFLHYLRPEDRKVFELQDVWFLGNIHAMREGIITAKGVGILPAYVVKSHVSQGKLVRVFRDLPPMSDYFRLIYRDLPFTASLMDAIAHQLRKQWSKAK